MLTQTEMTKVKHWNARVEGTERVSHSQVN